MLTRPRLPILPSAEAEPAAMAPAASAAILYESRNAAVTSVRWQRRAAFSGMGGFAAQRPVPGEKSAGHALQAAETTMGGHTLLGRHPQHFGHSTCSTRQLS